MKKKLQILFLVVILIVVPLIISSTTFISIESDIIRQSGVNEELDDTTYPSSYYISKYNINKRKQIYLELAIKSDSVFAHCAKVFTNARQREYNEEVINGIIQKINNREDGSDFEINALLRMKYLDVDGNKIPTDLDEDITNAILNFKYWFTEPGEDEMIFWTENHMILFHTAELLAGQKFRSEKFKNSGWTGTQHVEHALPLINRWLDWRAKFGFAEWNSNTYYRLDLTALMNLVDFSQNRTIAKKAEMLIDLICFDVVNNYYKGVYATAHGRTKDEVQFDTTEEKTAEPIWVLLGLGTEEVLTGDNSAAIFLATSNYNPPTILEDIAKKIALSEKHIFKSRNNIYISEGSDNGIGYESESDLMFWWPMSAPAAPGILESSLALIDKYDLDPKLVFQDRAFVTLFTIGATMYGTTKNEFSSIIKDITQGVALETANTYTYKTQYYQLSGVQDHQKGMNGLQELIWQACLDPKAIVFTSSPSGLSGKKQQFSSGWKPRATLYENVGVIQYDRRAQALLLELVLGLLLEEPTYTHAYFPRNAFDEWNRIGNWVFGRRGESYIALYSYNPIEWIDDYELRAEGKKNVWIVELGSVADTEYNSYQEFVNKILNAKIEIIEKSIGYEVIYESPSKGSVTVGWDGPMFVNYKQINFNDYNRFEGPYCNQEFGSKQTEIIFQNKNLELDFENAKKTLRHV